MRKENKILIKYFVLIFLASALIINWQEISYFFNYRIVFHFVSEVFSKVFYSASAAKTAVYIPDENFIRPVNFQPLKKSPPKEFEYSEKNNGLEIPKLGLWAPLIFPVGPSKKEITSALDKGVVHYPASVLPGEEGESVILGHSAALGRPKVKYDWVFSRLNELTEGDEIIFYFSGKKFKYRVKQKLFINKGEEIPKFSGDSVSVVTLISCWPPGKDIKRIVVRAE